MKKQLFIIVFLAFTCRLTAQNAKASTPITIEWVKAVEGDFSFIKNWSYLEGVGVKEDGKAGCADGGFCPERCYGMLDSNGIVLKDSVKIFYELLDTSHQFHSIKCEAWCYEWAGTDFITAIRKNRDTLTAYTHCNIATHCSLELLITNKICVPQIDLNSIVSNGSAIFFCTGGFIKIDKKLWDKGILKAEFSFQFDHPEKPEKPMYWRGYVYSSILNSN